MGAHPKVKLYKDVNSKKEVSERPNNNLKIPGPLCEKHTSMFLAAVVFPLKIKQFFIGMGSPKLVFHW